MLMKKLFLIFVLIFSVFAEDIGERFAAPQPLRPLILSLSGGGARGLAHIGVLKYFDEVGIIPDTIVGTSMGAVVGALYASGYTATEIYNILKPLSKGNLLFGNANTKSMRNKRQETLVTLRLDSDFNIVLPKSLASPQLLDGILGASVISAQMSSGGNFDKLPIPLRIWTTNLSAGGSQMHREGDILQIMKASAAAPGLMPPVRIGDDWHIDGGLRANIPLLDSVKRHDNIVLAIDVTSDKGDVRHLNSIVDVITLAVAMGMNEAEIRNAGLADFIVSPLEEGISNTDFFLFEEIVQAGYIAAKIAVEGSPKLQSYKNRNKTIVIPPTEFYVKAIELEGLGRTREWYLNRILSMDLSRPMTQERIERVTRIAEATEFFESFHITGRNDTLTAVVLEKERRSLGLGVRVDNHNLAEILAVPRYDNILGLGLSAGGVFHFGYLRKKILGELNLTLPIKQSFNWFVDFSGYISSQRLVSRQVSDAAHHNDRQIISYSESDIAKNGINAITGFEFLNSVSIFGGFRNETYRSRQSQGGDVSFAFGDDNNKIRMIMTGVESDYRDDTYFPSSGGRHRFWLSNASGEWGSRDRFTTINGFTSFVIPLNCKHTLIPLIHGTWADNNLPSAMRYYIGGGRYEDITSATNILYTIPFAGVGNRGLFADNFIKLELCWRYQFTRRQPLYLSLFVNVGDLWNYDHYSGAGNTIREYFNDIPVGIETELAYRTIIGPIRFSWSRLVSGNFQESFDIKRSNIFRFSAGFDF